MRAHRPLLHLFQIIVSLCLLCVQGVLWNNPACAQNSPQDVDAAMGKINQTLTNPAKLLDLHPTGQVRVDAHSNPQPDLAPVTLTGAPDAGKQGDPD